MTYRRNPLSRFNRWRDPKCQDPNYEYRSMRLADRPNGIAKMDPRDLPELFRYVAENIGTTNDVQILADIYAFLGNAQHLVPDVETVWTVTKTYSPDQTFRPGMTVSCYGCLTEEQARSIAEAMHQYYNLNKHAHWGPKYWDKYNVQYGFPISIAQVVPPNYTAEDFRRAVS